MGREISVLYVGDDREEMRTVSRVVEREYDAIDVTPTSDRRRALERLDDRPVDCLVWEYHPDRSCESTFLDAVRDAHPRLPVVSLAKGDPSASTSEALAAGATDVVPDTDEEYRYDLLGNRIEILVGDHRARRSAAASADEYRRLFQHVPVIFVVTRDRGGEPVVEDCNRRFLDQLGYSREEVLGRPLAEFYTSDSTATLLDEGGYERALRADFVTEERGLVASDGTVVETVLRAVPRRGPDGDVVGTFALFVNASRWRERERQLEALHTVATRFIQATSEAEICETLVETADETLSLPAAGVYLYDEEADLLRPATVSAAADRLFEEIPDFAPGEAIAWEVFETGERRVVDVRSHPKTYNPDTPVESELYIPLGDHGVFLSAATRHGAFDGNDVRFAETLAGHAVAALDRIGREVDLRRRKRELERFETIVSTAGEPIVTLDADHRFDAVNEAMETLTDRSRETLLGADPSLVMDDGDADAVRRTIERLLSGESSDQPIEVVVRTAGGERRVYLVTLAVLPFDEEYGGSVGIIRDITERQRREQRLEVLDRVVRHNLRNEMNVVRGRTEQPESTASAEEREHLEEIRSSATALLSVSEKVRLFNRVFQTGRSLGTVDVGRLVEEVVDEYRACRPDVTFRVGVSERAQGRAHDAFRMCVAELVENAVVHNDDPTATVDVTVDRVDDGDAVEVVVRDDGPGMPENERRILEGGKESQLEHSSGIGLWLVRWCVVEFGGEVVARTTEPTGTEVTVRLLGASTAPDAAPGGGR